MTHPAMTLIGQLQAYAAHVAGLSDLSADGNAGARAAKAAGARHRQYLLDALSEGPMTTAALARATCMSETSVEAHMGTLVGQGRVRRLNRRPVQWRLESAAA